MRIDVGGISAKCFVCTVTILSRCAREQVSRPTSSLAPVAALSFSTMICYRRSVESRSLDVKRGTFQSNGRLDRHSGSLRTSGTRSSGSRCLGEWRGVLTVLSIWH
jgi:hypothetical protein